MEQLFFKEKETNLLYSVDNDKYCTPKFLEQYKKEKNLEEITKEEFNSILTKPKDLTDEQMINEAKEYLNFTSWINDKYNDTVLVNKTMTHDEYVNKYKTIYDERAEKRALINSLEV